MPALLPRLRSLMAVAGTLWLITIALCSSSTGVLSKPTVFLATTMLPLHLPTSITAKTALGWATASGYRGTAIEQHLKLLSLLTLGIHCKVDVIVLPATAARHHVAETQTTWPTFRWSAQAVHALWDTPTINALLKKYDIKVVLGTSHREPSDKVTLPSYAYQARDISHIAADIERVTQNYMSTHPFGTNLTIFAPDLLLALRTQELPLYAEVAAAVKFAPKLVASAQAIVMHLESTALAFNGLHLHIGVPANEANELVVNTELMQYAAHIKALHFGKAPVYVTTGIFDAADVPDAFYTLVEDWIKECLVGQGHASVIMNRHVALNRTGVDDSAGKLWSEQKAVIDFLVLQYAQKVVASRSGTFAFMLQETRALKMVPRDTVSIVGQPWWLLPIAAGIQNAPSR